MRFVYATDLHGDAGAYADLIDLVADKRPDVLLLGGDLFAYSRSAASQLAFAERTLRPFLQPLREAGTPVALVHGNVDRRAAVEWLLRVEQEGLCRLLTLRPCRLESGRSGAAPVSAVGYPFVPPTGFRLKEHERRDGAEHEFRPAEPLYVSALDPAEEWVEVPPDYLQRLPSIEEHLAAAPPAPAHWLLVAHSPPWGVLDRTSNGARAGSRALLRWIAERRPVLALHGHVHEAPDTIGRWAERVGGTVCVNPGAAGEAGLQAVVGEVAETVLSLRHTTRGWF